MERAMILKIQNLRLRVSISKAKKKKKEKEKRLCAHDLITFFMCKFNGQNMKKTTRIGHG